MGNSSGKTETSNIHQEAKDDTSQQKMFRGNQFFAAIRNLPTLHSNVMMDIRKYRILSYRPPLAHHAIVISDRKNEDVTLELTVDENLKPLPKSAVFNGGDEKFLIEIGTKDCSLYEQTVIAQQVYDNHGCYNLIDNNCQDFCNKILLANGLPTYETDSQKLVRILQGFALMVLILI